MESINSTPTRDQRIDDMRKLLTWLKQHPEVPLPDFRVDHCILTEDDEDGLGHIATIASDLGVEPTTNRDGSNHYAARVFGTAGYRAFYVTTGSMAEYSAGQRHLRECASLQQPEVVDGTVVDEQRALTRLDEETAQVEEDAATRREVEAEQLAEVEAERTEEPTGLTGLLGGRYQLGDLIGTFDVDAPCDAPNGASYADGRCRCVVCGRCGHHTGNSNQGHYWAFCKVTHTTRPFHFCCPGDCALEAKPAAVSGE